MAKASSIGGAIGGALGTFAAGPVGTAIGSGLGTALATGIEAIPSIMQTDAERENKRRLAQLQRMQEMGTLGLTEAEKQNLFSAGQAQIQGQLRQAGAGIRSAGAAGMGGAGTEALRQAQLAEAQAGLSAQVSRDVGAANLQRQRELEMEIQERIGAKSDYETARRQALASIGTGAVLGAKGAFETERLMQGKAPTPAEIAAYAKAAKLTEAEAEAMISLEAKRPGMSRYRPIAGGE